MPRIGWGRIVGAVRRLPRRTRRLLLAGLLALALFGPGAAELARLSLRQRALDRRLAELAAEQARLSKERERLTSDPAYVEGLIRSTFKLAKPGEVVIPIGEEPSRGIEGNALTRRTVGRIMAADSHCGVEQPGSSSGSSGLPGRKRPGDSRQSR